MRTAIERLVGLAVPVLIRGETGTGKELVVRAIHDRSPLRDGPFLSINLGAIPRELAAAELFGATRGAFTGARDREGLFRTANGGTLFLDEVGEAPPEVQVTLLRVLETGEIFPVGGEKPVAVQVRLIAATDANLEDRIRQGQFKAPLLHRLASYEVRLPPLRERRDDIGPLFCHFAREELGALGETHRLSPSDPYAAPWIPGELLEIGRLERYIMSDQGHHVRSTHGVPARRVLRRQERRAAAAGTRPGRSVLARLVRETTRQGCVVDEAHSLHQR